MSGVHDIPLVKDLGKLIELINDRLRSLSGVRGAQDLTGTLDAHNYRIVNLGDPIQPQDALNLSSADRRYLTRSAVSEEVKQTVIQQLGAGTAKGGGSLVLSVPGTLSIRSNAAPLVTLGQDRTGSSIDAIVKQAPVGGDLKLRVYAGETLLGSITILEKQTSATVSLGKSIGKNAVVTLDIIGVGLTFPGADLTVMVRLA